MVKKKKETTLDDVLQATKQGFDSVEARMATKEDLKELENKLPTRKQIDALTKAVEKLAGRVKAFDEDTAGLKLTIKRHERRFQKIAKALHIDFTDID